MGHSNVSALQYVWGLYALRRVEADLTWFVGEGLLPPSACKGVPEAVRGAVTALAPAAQRLVDSWGIPEHLVAAPIAADWERYNVTDNQGELTARL
mmetsp:Transcript_45823/g.146134  ORF Transcript_45823/g.146134 Transcript_45823/m.146134 type:complete len:96 (+) Transcript_45823:2103-2390(+)